MYPDWPEPGVDLEPLPRVDGPKLGPFDFKGPQRIEFLEYLGSGQHSHVFKVQILGTVYALKLFRFTYIYDWIGPGPRHTELDDIEAVSAFYQYSEPFSAECRAFGRLQESGHEELAIECFGYLLLDEEHERTLMSRFSDLDLEFSGTWSEPGIEERSRYPGESGKDPPIRGIVKEFGQENTVLRVKDAKKALRDIIQLQQLGIVNIDPEQRQIINGKFADFSIAITTPHYMMNPEMNIFLTPEWRSAVEYEAFGHSLRDYLEFDNMIVGWNCELKWTGNKKHKPLSVFAFPNGKGLQIKYDLRKSPDRERAFSYVDPRTYDWRAPRPGKTLSSKPPRWYYEGSDQHLRNLKRCTDFVPGIEWKYRAGLICPDKGSHWFEGIIESV
ncbi:uncharacterized protein E0L32_007525 [Thyridium curvatum]|uniref:Uncharacterized protein n=1 Tax=Thyridium curvatum TaxID=1093900 RepID=A0A507B4J2_9PEZI|nr:uncharacterized protein E0L32_007525 [Thyridium curvatum]TPX11788.1 hypothetical protein E0L32_007525 [Thyridium curvatum]